MSKKRNSPGNVTHFLFKHGNLHGLVHDNGQQDQDGDQEQQSRRIMDTRDAGGANSVDVLWFVLPIGIKLDDTGVSHEQRVLVSGLQGGAVSRVTGMRYDSDAVASVGSVSSTEPSFTTSISASRTCSNKFSKTFPIFRDSLYAGIMIKVSRMSRRHLLDVDESLMVRIRICFYHNFQANEGKFL